MTFKNIGPGDTLRTAGHPSFKNIAPGDMLRTAGHTSIVAGIRHTSRGVVLDLIDTGHGKPATVTLRLLRRIAASGIDVRVIDGSRPTRDRRGHVRDVRRFRSLTAPTARQ